jgi:acyl-CoA synthetase (AMP-forming)/AMP-acid ligase II
MNSRYSLTREFVVINELPMMGTGKIDFRTLQKWFRELWYLQAVKAWITIQR